MDEFTFDVHIEPGGRQFTVVTSDGKGGEKKRGFDTMAEAESFAVAYEEGYNDGRSDARHKASK